MTTQIQLNAIHKIHIVQVQETIIWNSEHSFDKASDKTNNLKSPDNVIVFNLWMMLLLSHALRNQWTLLLSIQTIVCDCFHFAKLNEAFRLHWTV